MKLNKILVASTLAPAALAPLGVMTTSCANAWGHKAPLSIGSIEANDKKNPYYRFVGKDIKDIDGRPIVKYLPSNYIFDQQGNTNYSYSTPVETWFETKDGKSHKLPIDQWKNGTSAWYSPSSSFTTSCTEIKEIEGQKYNVTQACAQNITLTANISFVVSIAQFINKYVTYALNYATSQVHDQNDFATAWGGSIPTTTDENKRALYELMFANSNAHAGGETDAYLKTTAANFNFNENTFPIPAYNGTEVSPVTKKLLTGNENADLASEEGTIYWSAKQENGNGDDKYTVYTYPCVPIIVSTTGLTQRFINAKKSGSIFVQDYYQNDKEAITKAIGDSWSSMEKVTGDKNTKPSYYKYDLEAKGKSITFDTGREDKVDQRLKALNPKGNDFIAFVTYSYVKWDKPRADLNRNNTVTLSSLQTVMPAYLLDRADLFKKAKSDKDNSGYIVDTTKADSYSTELINLLSRNSDQGRVAKASQLSDRSKAYLKFLENIFGTDSGLSADFIKPLGW